jgi:hypothetical protein
MTDVAPPPAPAKPDFKANFVQLPLVEKVLGGIALIVIIGWIVMWTSKYGQFQGFFTNWFTPFSFLGALTIVALVSLKVLGVRVLAPNVEAKVIPIASLVPVLGYLIELLRLPAHFLTAGGSIALAYISATTYWKRRIPAFATAPLGAPAAEGPPPAAPPPPAPPV